MLPIISMIFRIINETKLKNPELYRYVFREFAEKRIAFIMLQFQDDTYIMSYLST